MPHLRYVAHSEIGLVRKNNQDSGYASPTMLVVADGMGGAAAGDLASAVAITELQAADAAWDRLVPMLTVMEDTVTRANRHIAELVVDDHGLDGMGTTVCGALFDGERLGVVHIGDSRGYLWRDGELIRLTSDHSWVQSLVDEGRICEEEALYHPHRSLLLKVLNGHPSNCPDLFHVRVRAGDRILFCSDGLCGLVEDATIADGLRPTDRDTALAALVAAAHAAGGLDNITIVLADVVAEEPTPALAPVLLGAAGDAEIPALRHATMFADPRTPGAGNATDGDTPAAPVLPRVAGATALPRSQSTPDLDGVLAAGAIEDPEDARYRPRPRTGRRWVPVLVGLLAVGLLAGLAALVVRNHLESVRFIGVAQDRVAIFRGVPGEVGPLQLSRLDVRTETEVNNLAPRYAEAVRRNEYRSLTPEAATTQVRELGILSEQCLAQRRQRTTLTEAPPPTVAPSPPQTPTGDPAATPPVLGPTAVVDTPTQPPPQPPPPEEC